MRWEVVHNPLKEFQRCAAVDESRKPERLVTGGQQQDAAEASQSRETRGSQASGLLKAVLDDIAALKIDAETSTKTLYPERVEEQKGRVWLAMVERYAVYLNYKFAALKKGEADE